MLQINQASVAARRPLPSLAQEDPELGGLEAYMSTRRYQPRERVCDQGDRADVVYFVKRGLLKAYKATPDGRRQIVGFLHEGDILGLACEDEQACSAEAVTEAVVARAPRARLEQIAARSAPLGSKLLRAARSELARAQEQMLLLGRMSPLERVASLLLRFSDAADSRGEDPRRLALPMSRLDIADHLGLTIETVSRCFTKLRKGRIIDLPRASDVVVRNLDRLAELAAGDEDGMARAA